MIISDVISHVCKDSLCLKYYHNKYFAVFQQSALDGTSILRLVHNSQKKTVLSKKIY